MQFRREDPGAGTDRRVARRPAEDLGGACGRAEDVEQKADGRRLARPVRPEEPEDLATHDLQV
jgi:hypothetical protein